MLLRSLCSKLVSDRIRRIHDGPTKLKQQAYGPYRCLFAYDSSPVTGPLSFCFGAQYVICPSLIVLWLAGNVVEPRPLRLLLPLMLQVFLAGRNTSTESFFDIVLLPAVPDRDASAGFSAALNPMASEVATPQSAPVHFGALFRRYVIR